MIKISNISINYKKKKAVDNLSLTIDKGESILLAGPNGSGKTTLLRAAAGVLNSRMGEVSIDDRKVDYLTRKKTGPLTSPQSPQMAGASGDFLFYAINGRRDILLCH